MNAVRTIVILGCWFWLGLNGALIRAADRTAPSIPADLSSSQVTATGFTLTWAAATDNVKVTGYRVLKNGAALGTTAAVAMPITGLKPGTVHAMTVQARDAAGNWSRESPALAVTTAADTTAPTAPGQLAGSAISLTRFTLGWAAATDNVKVTGYEVFKDGVSLGRTDARKRTVSGLVPNTAYIMTVRACDAAGNWSGPSAPLVVTTFPDTTAPSNPTGLASRGLSLTTFTLTWAAATDDFKVAAYEVFRNGVSIGITATHRWNVTGLAPGTAYAMAVRAQDAAGNWSERSAPLVVTTIPDVSPPTVPASLAVGDVTGTSFTLNWGAATDNVAVWGYEIANHGIPVGSTTTTSLTLTGLAAGTLYEMTVRARDTSGNWSKASAGLAVMLNGLPFIANFEPAEGYQPGSWSGRNGWSVTGTADIVASPVFAGTQALSLSPAATVSSASRTFSGVDPAVTFIDIFAVPAAGASPDAGRFLETESAVVALVNSGDVGVVQAYDGAGGGRWVSTGVGPALDLTGRAAAWSRITIRCDYPARKWDLFFNGQLALANLGFKPDSPNALTVLTLGGNISSPTGFDELFIAFDNPLFADADHDGMDDAWESAHGLNPAVNDRDGDLDGDGRNNLQEFLLGSNPQEAEGPVPADAIAGLRLWLRADLGVTVDAQGGVVAWADQSREHQDAFQDAAVARPQRVAASLNAQPVVRFDGQSSVLYLPNLMNGATQGEIFIVARLQDFTNPANGLAHFGVGGGTIYGAGEMEDDFGHGDDGSFVPPRATVLLRPHLYNASISTGGLAELRFNQADFLQRPGQSVIFRPDPILGADWQGDHFHGDVAEVIVYDRVLSAAERDAVDTYLFTKYALNGPATLERPTLRAMAASSTTVALSWSAPSSGQYATTVERQLDDGAWSVLATPEDATSRPDTGLKAGRTYFYRVRNANPAGVSPYSEISAITLPAPGNVPTAGLRLWLRADVGVTLDERGGAVTWRDQAADRDAGQSVLSHRPQWVPAAANGQPVMRFDGADDQFALPDVMAGATAGEIMVVARLQDFTNPYNGLLHFGTGYATVYGGDGAVWDDFGTASLDPHDGPGAALLTSVHAYDSSVSADGETVLRFNGVEFWRSTGQGVTFRPDPLIGADWLGDAFKGDIAEVIAYDHVLTAAERLAVSDDLNQRYAVVAVPEAPVGLAATAVSPTRVTLTWSQPGSTPEISYTIERKSGSSAPYAAIAAVVGATTWADVGLASGGNYSYRVKAGYAFGSGPYSIEAAVATSLDSDGDDISDADEIANHTDPLDFYNGQPPVLTIVGGGDQLGSPGTYLTEPVLVRVTRADGTPLANAPLVFELADGNGGIALVRGAAASESSIAVRTDAKGTAQVFLKLSSPAANDLLRVRPETTSGTPIYLFGDPPAPLTYVAISLRPTDVTNAASLMPRKVTENGRVLLVNEAVTPYEFGTTDAGNVFHRAGYTVPVAAGYRWIDGNFEPLHLQPPWQPPGQVVELTDEGFTYGYLHTAGLIGVTDMNDVGDVIGFVGTNFFPLADSSDIIYFRHPACWPVHGADAVPLAIGDANPTYRTEGLIKVDYDGLRQSYRRPALFDLKAIADDGKIIANFTDPGLSVPGHLIPDQDQHQGTCSWSSFSSGPVFSENQLTLAVSPDGSEAVATVQDLVHFAFPIHSRVFPYEIIESVELYRYSAPTWQVNGVAVPYAVTGPINRGGRYLSGASWAESGSPLQPIPGLAGGSALAANDRNDIFGRKTDGSFGLWAWQPTGSGPPSASPGIYFELPRKFDLPAGWQIRDLAPSINHDRMLAGRIAQVQNASGNPVPVDQQVVAPVLLVPVSVAADVARLGFIRPDRMSSYVTPASPVLLLVNGAAAGHASVPAGDLSHLVPVVLNLKGLLAALPPSAGYTYMLKQADSALSFVYTSLTPAGAASFRLGDLTTGFGRTLDRSLADAGSEPITAEGVSLASLFLDLIVRQEAGVLLLEGRNPSTAPLIIAVSGPDGAICQVAVPLNSVEAELAVDANHDGRITLAREDPGDVTSVSQPYRTWLNDDDDMHAPGPPQRADYTTARVDGAKDLEDFFPVVLNLAQLVKALPPGRSTKYMLKQADGAVNFVETNLTRATAFTYQATTDASGFGAALAEPASSATTQQVTPAGVELSVQFLNNLRDHDQGVILVEGRAPSTQPLVLAVERDGRLVAEVALPLSLGARILLLLHGMNSNPATWDPFRAAAFGGSSTDIFDGNIYPPITGTRPRPTACGVLCYRLKFGAVETAATAKEGLEHLTTTTAEGFLGSTALPYLNIDIKCGDFETFDELGQEVDATVAALLDRYPNAQIVLLGHSRGGLAARAFLEGTSPRKSAVAGLLTTSTPHLGSRLAQIYQWLADHPRPAGPPDDDWQVVEFLRHPTVTIGGITLSEKETLDVRRPVIGDVASGPYFTSAALAALNEPVAVGRLPANIRYGEIVYEKAPLGLMTTQPPSLIRYTVFDEVGTANPFDQLSNAAAACLLGPDNHPDSFPGDGLIPAGDQVFTQLPGFPVPLSSLQPNTFHRLIVTNPEVVHEGAPSRTDDLLVQLRLLAPGWFSPMNP